MEILGQEGLRWLLFFRIAPENTDKVVANKGYD